MSDVSNIDVFIGYVFVTNTQHQYSMFFSHDNNQFYKSKYNKKVGVLLKRMVYFQRSERRPFGVNGEKHVFLYDERPTLETL